MSITFCEAVAFAQALHELRVAALLFFADGGHSGSISLAAGSTAAAASKPLESVYQEEGEGGAAVASLAHLALRFGHHDTAKALAARVGQSQPGAAAMRPAEFQVPSAHHERHVEGGSLIGPWRRHDDGRGSRLRGKWIPKERRGRGSWDEELAVWGSGNWEEEPEHGAGETCEEEPDLDGAAVVSWRGDFEVVWTEDWDLPLQAARARVDTPAMQTALEVATSGQFDAVYGDLSQDVLFRLLDAAIIFGKPQAAEMLASRCDKRPVRMFAFKELAIDNATDRTAVRLLLPDVVESLVRSGADLNRFIYRGGCTLAELVIANGLVQIAKSMHGYQPWPCMWEEASDLFGHPFLVLDANGTVSMRTAALDAAQHANARLHHNRVCFYTSEYDAHDHDMDFFDEVCVSLLATAIVLGDSAAAVQLALLGGTLKEHDILPSLELRKEREIERDPYNQQFKFAPHSLRLAAAEAALTAVLRHEFEAVWKHARACLLQLASRALVSECCNKTGSFPRDLMQLILAFATERPPILDSLLACLLPGLGDRWYTSCSAQSSPVMPAQLQVTASDSAVDSVPVIEEVEWPDAPSDEEPAAVPPAEAELTAAELWASSVERQIASDGVSSFGPGSAASSSHSGELEQDEDLLEQSQRHALLHYNHWYPELKAAVFESAPAKAAVAAGIDVQPTWARGALVLVPGLGPELEVPGVQLLRMGHVVVAEGDEAALNAALELLPFRVKKLKLSGRCVVPDVDSLFGVSSSEGAGTDGGSCSGKSLSSTSKVEGITARLGGLGIEVRRTFIHIPQPPL
ncbi:unnamed protein product, partial [Polarella glacialis]